MGSLDELLLWAKSKVSSYRHRARKPPRARNWHGGHSKTQGAQRISQLVCARDQLTVAEKDQVVGRVPIRAVRSLHTIPVSISEKLDRSMSIHGLLAAEPTLDIRRD